MPKYRKDIKVIEDYFNLYYNLSKLIVKILKKNLRKLICIVKVVVKK